MMDVALVTSDWHLNNTGKITTKFDVSYDFEYSLFQIAEFINLKNINTMFLLGDIFDKAFVNANSLNLIKKFDEFLTNKVICFFILGQHDPKPQIMENIKTKNIEFVYSNEKIVNFGNLKILMMDYMHKSEENEKKLYEILNYSNCDVLMTHQVWREFIMSEVAWEASKVFARNKYINTIITGDYHKTSFLSIEIDGKLKKLVSCGSIVFTDFGLFQVNRSFVSISQKKDFYEFNHEIIKTRLIKKFKISNDNDFIDFKSFMSSIDAHIFSLPEPLKKGIFVIEISNEMLDKNGAEINELLKNHYYSIVIRNFSDSKSVEEDIDEGGIRPFKKNDEVTFEKSIRLYCKLNNIDKGIENDSIEVWYSALRNKEEQLLLNIVNKIKKELEEERGKLE